MGCHRMPDRDSQPQTPLSTSIRSLDSTHLELHERSGSAAATYMYYFKQQKWKTLYSENCVGRYRCSILFYGEAWANLGDYIISHRLVAKVCTGSAEA